MRATKRLELLENIASALQDRYTLSDIQIYLSAFNINNFEYNGPNSKRIFAKHVLTNVTDDLLESIALDLEIATERSENMSEGNPQFVDPFPTIIELKDFIVDHFDAENLREIGILTDHSTYVENHDRLLRSLSFGDPDYSGNVLGLLTSIQNLQDSGIGIVKNYISRKFPSALNAVAPNSLVIESENSFGFKYTKPRNDIVSVMMPFDLGFNNAYEAIKSVCRSINFPCRRADEVWDSSVVIHDVLELILHSKVVVCDLTGRNPNVFYELGIAHAWGKNVIPITQNMDDVPFDLRHHRCLKYINNGEGLGKLEENLGSRIRKLVNQ